MVISTHVIKQYILWNTRRTYISYVHIYNDIHVHTYAHLLGLYLLCFHIAYCALEQCSRILPNMLHNYICKPLCFINSVFPFSCPN